MRRQMLIPLLLVLVGIFANHCYGGAVWGSFDQSRVNYTGGVLTTGSAHSGLRSIITGAGNTLAPATSALTPAYLGDIDVFYTSLLDTTDGILDSAEQSALQAWVADGGTLIVTADIFPLPAYESFTSMFGVTGYVANRSSGVGSVIAAHPITAGVTNFMYNTESTYAVSADGLVLGVNSSGDDYMAVLEPATGFTVGGRLLVFGDHNMFANANINSEDNTQLATNMVQWAMVPEPTTFAFVLTACCVATVVRRR